MKPQKPPPTAHRQIQPEGWPQPRGYTHGISAYGRTLFISGQVGVGDSGPGQPQPSTNHFCTQFCIALDRVLSITDTAGGNPNDIASMTIYVCSMEVYRKARAELAHHWRARFGTYYPAMAIVAVQELLDPEAIVEIQAVAVLPTA